MNNSSMDCAASWVQDAMQHPVETVKQHPAETALIVFGLGVGLGFVIGQSLAAPIAHWMEPEPSLAQRVGRQVLDAVGRVMPQAVGR